MFVFLGILIGFLAAIPLGPINVYAVSQALKRDFMHSFWVGLTAAFLDIVYSFVAIIGFSQVALVFDEYKQEFKVFGAALLIFISIRLIRQSKTYQAAEEADVVRRVQKSYSRPIIVTLFLYVSNPTLYIFWLAVAGTVTAHHLVTFVGWRPLAFALFCGLGSTLWYLILASYVSKFRKIFKPSTFRVMLQGLAVVLIGFALFSLGTIF